MQQQTQQQQQIQQQVQQYQQMQIQSQQQQHYQHNQQNTSQEQLWMKWKQRNDQQRQLYLRKQQQQNEQQQQIMQQQIQQNMHGYSIPMHNNVIYSQQPVSNDNHGGASSVNSSSCNIFLRIRPNVGMDKIRDYLISTGVNIINFEKVSHSSARFNSFKISVHSNDYFKIINDPFLSLCGAKCRPWSEKGNNHFNNDLNNYNKVNTDNDLWDNMSYIRYHY